MAYEEELRVVDDLVTQRGFSEVKAAGWQKFADAAGLSDNGPYKVLHAYENGDAVVIVEQNTSPAGDGIIVTAPPVVIGESGNGRLAAMAEDPDAVDALLDHVLGEVTR